MAGLIPGALTTAMLADLGADVIIIERAPDGDPIRQFPGLFAALNRNKRSVALDLGDAEQRRQLHGLVHNAEVFLEGMRPGAAARLELDHRTLSRINPDLVYVSLSGFGQDGPYRHRPAHDLTYQALAGALDLPGGLQRWDGLHLADLVSGLYGACAVLLGLYRRKGRGWQVDVSMFDCLVSFLSPYLTPAANRTAGLDLSGLRAYGTFRCSDNRLLTLSVTHEQHFWRALCEALGMAHHAVLTHAQRADRAEDLRAEIATRILRAPLNSWLALLPPEQVPRGEVRSLSEVLDDPHVTARGLISEIDGQRYIRQPLRMDGARWSVERPPPRIGEHNIELLKED